MVEIAQEALGDTDVIALLVEAGIGSAGEVGVPEVIREVLETLAGRPTPIVLVLNKIDQLDREQLLPIIDAWREIHDFAEIVPVSALEGHGVSGLVETFLRYLPKGPFLYPDDALTDLPERFIAAEIIREQLFHNLDKELPYSVQWFSWPPFSIPLAVIWTHESHSYTSSAIVCPVLDGKSRQTANGTVGKFFRAGFDGGIGNKPLFNENISFFRF